MPLGSKSSARPAPTIAVVMGPSCGSRPGSLTEAGSLHLSTKSVTILKSIAQAWRPAAPTTTTGLVVSLPTPMPPVSPAACNTRMSSGSSPQPLMETLSPAVSDSLLRSRPKPQGRWAALSPSRLRISSSLQCCSEVLVNSAPVASSPMAQGTDTRLASVISNASDMDPNLPVKIVSPPPDTFPEPKGYSNPLPSTFGRNPKTPAKATENDSVTGIFPAPQASASHALGSPPSTQSLTKKKTGCQV